MQLNNIRATGDAARVGITVSGKTRWITPTAEEADAPAFVAEQGKVLDALTNKPRADVGPIYCVHGQDFINIALAIGDVVGTNLEAAFLPENYQRICEYIGDPERIENREYVDSTSDMAESASMAWIFKYLMDIGVTDSTLDNYQWLRGVITGLIIGNETESGFLTGAARQVEDLDSDDYERLLLEATKLLYFAYKHSAVFLWDSQSETQKAASRAEIERNVELIKSGKFTILGEEVEA
jgi:hypothetical protein